MISGQKIAIALIILLPNCKTTTFRRSRVFPDIYTRSAIAL
ncbi:hypothetical protein [[Scytonema hofmanni] UTEX B 1581]|nr:hypothetical protein [[Scytonema hofmanni] UTEX B 1581]